MGQKLYKFRGNTLDEAYRHMRQRLGRDALVINTHEIPVKGIMGLLGRRIVEVTASAPQSAGGAARPGPSRTLSSAERRYAGGGAGAVASDPNIAYYEKLLSNAQRRMAETEKHIVRSVERPAQPAAAVGESKVVPFPKREPQEVDSPDAIRQQMREMREMLQVLVAESPGAGLPQEFAPHYRQLVDSGVTRKAAASLVAAAAFETNAEVLRDPLVFRERLKLEMRKRVRVSGGLTFTPGASRLIALVGSTGVGKTTNLAKLAAVYALRERARVALLTADTYRVGAADQLMKYANIIGVPMKVIHDAREMAAARKEFADYDLVFMDTAGGSQFNTRQIHELKLMLTAAQPDEISLVMSATAQLEDMRSIAANFGCLKPSSVVFTKLDETRKFGHLYSILTEQNLPLSFMSIGQNVPDDLVLGHPGMIANLVLEGRDKRGRPSTASA